MVAYAYLIISVRFKQAVNLANSPDCILFTFTFMHLADAFIQSDLHCIQVTVSTFYQLLLSLGIEPMILAVASAMLYQLSYRKACICCFTWMLMRLRRYLSKSFCLALSHIKWLHS